MKGTGLNPSFCSKYGDLLTDSVESIAPMTTVLSFGLPTKNFKRLLISVSWSPRRRLLSVSRYSVSVKRELTPSMARRTGGRLRRERVDNVSMRSSEIVKVKRAREAYGLDSSKSSSMSALKAGGEAALPWYPKAMSPKVPLSNFVAPIW